MLPRARLVMTSCILFAFLTGCASTGGPPKLDDIKPLLQLAVSLATDRLLVQNPKAVPLVVDASTVLLDVFDAQEFTSITQVREFILSRIPWSKLPPQAQPVILVLMEVVSDELRLVVERQKIPETQAVLLAKDIITWVRIVALRHAGAVVPQRTIGAM